LEAGPGFDMDSPRFEQSIFGATSTEFPAWRSLPPAAAPRGQLCSFGRQSPSLVIVEPEASITHLLSKDAILLDQICNDLLLVLAHPAGNRRISTQSSQRD